MYDIVLNQLSARKEPIDIIMAGMGFMGFGFFSSIARMPGMRIPLVISRRPHETASFLQKKGFAVQVTSSTKVIQAGALRGVVSVSDDLSLIRKLNSHIVIEMTGTITYGTEVALTAIQAHKHIVTMNPELQATVGAELKVLADRNNVVITDVYGDQPGSLARLISQARVMGFEVKMAGNMKRYLDIHATQEKMAPWAKSKGLAVKQTTSFTDGTKQSIEMNLVANYFGMSVLKRGMVGPELSRVQDVLGAFDWEQIPPEGVVDYVIGRDMFPGVFVVGTHTDPHQKQYLSYLGLGDGPYYLLFEPYHLCHLEVAQTIAKVVLFRSETIQNPVGGTTKTVALAKNDLTVGMKLEGIGGDTCYGMIDAVDRSEGFLPMGFAEHAIVKRPVAKDSPIALEDVILPVTVATKLAGLVQTQSNHFSLPQFFSRIAQIL